MKTTAPVRDAVLKALAERGPMTTPQVTQAIRGDANGVSCALRRLLKDGVVQVKRGKCTSANFGQPQRGANTWRIKPVINKNIHGTPLMHEPIAPAGDKIPA